MSKKQIDSESQDFSQNFVEPAPNAPQNAKDSAENSINYTTNKGSFTQNLPQENSANFIKTVDPVSEFGISQGESANQISFSLEEDNLLFQRLFPGVLRENVENDEVFKLFSRFVPKNTPFASIYSDYLALVDKISDNAIKRK